MAITVEDENLGHATAYAYAKSKGYAGTEEEFAEDLKKSAEYADNAAASATSASESATNAANSATAAGNAQTAAESAKTAAQSAQTAAESAKTSAQSSATSAGNSATAASGSASNASASASSAASSASSASSSASSASASATAAGNSATSAGTSATNAAGSATSAASSATAASGSATDAQNAKTAAQNAQTAAESARDQAQEYAESIDPDTLAKKDGTYEDLTSGTTEQLLSDVYTKNSEPYLFRKTSGSDKVGSREYLDKIVGGSLVINQYINKDSYAASETVNGITYTNNADGSVTANGTATDTVSHSLGSIPKSAFVEGHKYYVGTGFSAEGSSSTYELQIYRAQSSGSFNAYKDAIFSIANLSTISKEARFVVRNGATVTNLKLTPQFIDLTAEFGSTIADYVYSLETATAGAGIAWLKQYIDLDTYHEYSAPTLKHVEGLVSHDTVGFNQWDEVWEVGRYKPTTGGKETFPTTIRSKNFIPVLPNASYYCRTPVGIITAYINFCYYDANKNFISFASNAINPKVTPNGAHFMTFYVDSVYGTTYKNDICINLSCSKNGTYEPYQKRSYPLDSSVVLRGIPTLVNGKLKYDGDEYLYDGTIKRNWVIANLGELNWAYDSTYNFFYHSANTSSPIYGLKSDSRYVCDKYVYGGAKTDPQMADVTTGIYSHGAFVYIKDTAYNDAVAFKASLSGTYFIYEKWTPTTEQAEPFRQLQICDTYGTEEFVTTSEVPVGTETRYPEDLKAKIEGLPWDLSMIAPIEDGTTASQAYTTGQYFLHNNVFCKALTNIASGATFTLGTNYTETTVAAELYTALH